MSQPSTQVEQGAALFDRLYAGYARSVHAYFLGRTGDDQRAVDLLQDTFVRVWRHLADLRSVPPERQRFWLFGIARNVLTDAYRRQASQQRLVEQSAQQAEPLAHAATTQTLEGALDVDAAMSRLPEDLRLVLTMSVLGEMTSAEIGEALGRPAGTVRYQLSRARARLAAELGLDNAAPRAKEGQ